MGSPPKHILVVDDDRRICEVVTEFLKDENFEVFCVYDGPEALRLLTARNVDVAIIDLLLPGEVSGEAVVERASMHGVKVVTMSGKLASDRRGRDFKGPHLRKPFRMMQLRSMIDRVLGAG